jgi:hypothetical protein
MFMVLFSLSLPSLAGYDKNKNYVNFCAGSACIEGKFSLSKESKKDLAHIYDLVDRLEFLGTIMSYAGPIYEILSTNSGDDQIASIIWKVTREDWDGFIGGLIRDVPLYKMSVMNNELNYILYKHISKKSPQTDQQFWRKMKLSVISAMERLRRPECDGIYCGKGCVNDMSIDVQLSLIHPSKGWRAKVSMKVCGRSNIIDSDDVELNNQTGYLSIKNPRDSRNVFEGSFSQDRKSIQLSNKLNNHVIWRVGLNKNQ